MSGFIETVIVQSFRPHDVPGWLTRCLRSVEAWSRGHGFTYRFIGDELFAPLPPRFRARAAHLPQVLADLGRLLAARDALARGARRVVWIDADVLVFDPERLVLPDDRALAMCAEVWIEPRTGDIAVEDRINNAACLFTERTTFLPFYIDACQQIVDDTVGTLDPLAIGTRFLTAIDRLVRLPTLDAIGLVSPWVLQELATAGNGPLLELLRSRHRTPLAAVNLCASFRDKTFRTAVGAPSFVADDPMFEAVVDRLLGAGRLG